jgi:PhnB protein
MTVKPIPEGNPSIAPRPVVKDAARALEFYAKAFGATNPLRHTDSSGRTSYAQSTSARRW